MNTKRCCRCRTDKTLTEFYKDKSRKDGFNATCKSCQKEHRNLRYRTDPDYRARRLKAVAEQKLKHSDRYKEYMRNYELQRKYGITAQEYDAVLEEQGGLCAICKEPARDKRLAVDHCHDSDKIRGLLCGNCNRGIGLLRHDPELFNKAIAYLTV